jgi:vacuolar protein sorting-associated protein 13A/C
MGIYGVVAEPIKGAKKNGLKGGVKGFGKGIIGLFAKPVGGTIQFFTKTARGINNTPGTLYKGLTKRKVKRS